MRLLGGISPQNPRPRSKTDGNVLHTVDERRLEPLYLTIEANVGHPVKQVVEHHLDLHLGEVRAQAEVGSATAERHVGIWFAPDVELVGVLEDIGVTVRRDVKE